MEKFINFKRKILNNKFYRNILIIAGGTAFAQALGFLLSPIITRIYSPSDYGVFTSFTAIISLIVIGASLDYHKAIPIADSDENARSLFKLSSLVLVGSSLLMFLIVLFLGDLFLKVFTSEVLYNYRFFIPLGIFLTGLYQILLQSSYRIKNYNGITKTKFSQSISANFTKIFLGLLNFGPIGLIIGSIMGSSAGLLTLGIPLYKRNKSTDKNVSNGDVRKMAIRFKKFPIYSAPSNYVYNAGNQLPIIFLLSIFGASVSGLFGLAKTVISLPIGLIGMSVSQVFYAEAASIGKEDPIKIKNLAIDLVKKLALIASVPSIILLFLGPQLFSFVFGNEWKDAGKFAAILSIMLFFHFTILPLGRLLEIFEKQNISLLLNVFRLVGVIVIFILASVFSFTAINTIIIYSIFATVFYVCLFFLVFKVINKSI